MKHNWAMLRKALPSQAAVSSMNEWKVWKLGGLLGLKINCFCSPKSMRKDAGLALFSGTPLPMSFTALGQVRCGVVETYCCWGLKNHNHNSCLLVLGGGALLTLCHLFFTIPSEIRFLPSALQMTGPKLRNGTYPALSYAVFSEGAGH